MALIVNRFSSFMEPDCKVDYTASPPPPPYVHAYEGPVGSLYTISCSTSTQCVAQHASNPVSVTTYRLTDVREERVRYSVAVPKKREGWKATVSYLTEKSREETRYEVRREPLARRYDLRDAEGNHNVLIPTSSLNHKSFSVETPDGQKLLWRKVITGWELLSLPSQTLIARYTMVTAASPRLTASSPRLNDAHASSSSTQFGALEITSLPVEDAPALHPSASSLPAPAPRRLSTQRRSSAQLQRTTSQGSVSSSSSSDGPRLGGIYQRLALGLCAPAAIAASVASPYAAAGMNRHCMIGDELSNLGRATIRPPPPKERKAMRASDSSWLQMNLPSSVRKSYDPRPRKVDLDLIISTFIAVLAG